VFVRQIVGDDAAQEACDIVQKRVLKFADHEGGRSVLGEQADKAVLDAGIDHGFLQMRRDIDQLLFFGCFERQSIKLRFHDSRVARIKASI